jgi:hypothetical protein
MNNLENFIKIVNHGQFYYPAWKHYNNPNTNVCCDRCGKKYLSSSIGLLDRDLCLSCTDEVIILYKKDLNILPRPPFVEPMPTPNLPLLPLPVVPNSPIFPLAPHPSPYLPPVIPNNPTNPLNPLHPFLPPLDFNNK